MAQRTKEVILADGRIIRLTSGEIRALKRYTAKNGEHGSSPEGHQHDPGNASHLTRQNLVTKGIFEMTEAGLPRYAKGVLSK